MKKPRPEGRTFILAVAERIERNEARRAAREAAEHQPNETPQHGQPAIPQR